MIKLSSLGKGFAAFHGWVAIATCFQRMSQMTYYEHPTCFVLVL